MNTHRFFVEKTRFHMTEPNKFLFEGWFFDGSTKGHTLSVSLDGVDLPLELVINKGYEIRQKYSGSMNEIEEEVVGIVTLPEGWSGRKKLVIHSTWGEETTKVFSIATAKLLKRQSEIPCYIENCTKGDGKVSVSGWCVADGELRIVLFMGDEPLPSQKTEHYYRKDLLGSFPECDRLAKYGFSVQADLPEGKRGAFHVDMRTSDHASRRKLVLWNGGTKRQRIMQKMEHGFRYLVRNGAKATWYKILGKVRKREQTSYDAWRKKYEVTAEELKRERAEVWESGPLFSVVVPAYQTKPEYLKELIASLAAQTYRNFELCIALAKKTEHTANLADDELSDRLAALLADEAKRDARVRYTVLDENRGIAGNTNAALSLATGDVIVLADHDDLLAPNALYELADAMRREPSCDVLYSDEDKVSMDGKHYFEPHFKSDYNPDMLCSVNYICHIFAVKRELAERVGAFDPAYDGAQDHDFILRCCEQADKICHIPKILYHWRSHMDSTAAKPESKLYAFDAGRRAVEAHYKRCGIPARVENGPFYGQYHTVYEWDEEPLISIIIPNKDHTDDLDKCIRSIEEKSSYRKFEFVIVENNSTEPETFAYYEELERKNDHAHVVFYEGSFNYAKINNFGASHANGSYYLLLNNDTEMIGADAIRELLGYCMRPDVGIVGAKLLYPDDTIQHAGTVLGFGGMAGHTFIGKSRTEPGYFGRIQIAQDYNAVTAACLMTKRDVFEEVGGMTEQFVVAFNDVDFCLKVRRTGKLVVYNPYAEFYHYESKSRGLEDSPEKVERFQGETDLLLTTWGTLIEAGDCYYNPNLTLYNSDFSLRK